jgi:hypothetical protein
MMKTNLIIAIGITIGLVAWASIGIVLAHNFAINPYYSGVRTYSTPGEDEDWWNEMRQYMEEQWDEVDDATQQQTTDEEFEQWWDEMKDHMEERWVDDNGAWWDEMRQHMEDRWEDLENGDCGYVGFGRGCLGW